MTITKKMATVLLTLIMLVSLIPATVFAAGKSGWEKQGNYWYYYKNDKALKATWLQYLGKWYYFGSDGKMYSDRSMTDADKKVYVFDKSGAMVTKKGWVKSNAFNEGSMRSGWFYVNKGGTCATGWKKMSGKWYYFLTVADGYSAGYYDYSGYLMDVPSTRIGGKVYVFNSDGSLVTKTKWVSIKYSGTTYWFYVKKGGIATTGWKQLGGKWYYFDPYGPMLCNTTQTIKGKSYTFDKNGVCLNP